jgi:acetyl-CoA C-acetyltransferase
MSAHGIRDKVAVVGMGCTRFAEHWDRSVDDLLLDASAGALTSAGIGKDDVDAYWLGTTGSGVAGLALAKPSH